MVGILRPSPSCLEAPAHPTPLREEAQECWWVPPLCEVLGSQLQPLTPAGSRKALKVLIHPGSEPTDLRPFQRWAPVVLSANLSTLRSALSQGGGYSPPQTGMLASLPGPGRRVVVPQTSIPCMVQASES